MTRLPPGVNELGLEASVSQPLEPIVVATRPARVEFESGGG